MKEHIAPFFYFERVNGQGARFVGIAVPFVEGKALEEVLKFDNFTIKEKGEYQNYVGLFTILEVTVPRLWLYDLKYGNFESEYIPTTWQNFLQTRELPFKYKDNENENIIPSNITNNHPENIGYRMTV